MSFFFYNHTATTEIYTLALHDALPICSEPRGIAFQRAEHVHQRLDRRDVVVARLAADLVDRLLGRDERVRSEEHTSALQSQSNLLCRLPLAKKTIPPNSLHRPENQLSS